MGRGLYKNLREIPIPDWAKVNKATDMVYVVLNTRNKRGDFNRRLIGKRANKHTMYANDNLRVYYPDEWNKYYEGKLESKSDFLHFGLYAAVLGILQKTGLYNTLLESFGPLYANALVDFSMYSILYKSDSALSFASLMSDEVLFSEKAYSDSWYSEMFHSITGDKRKKFLNLWLAECRKENLDNVWICIDGSNSECSSETASLSVPGHSKTKDSGDIVSYMYAVNGNTGIPLAYDVYHGSVVDKSGFSSLVTILKDNDIHVKGVILDRGFCTINVINAVKEMECSYLIMAPDNTIASITMMDKYADTIRWNVDYVLNNKGIFGIKDKVRLFSNSKEEGYAYLLFDGSNGTERALRLIYNIFDAHEVAQREIANGNKISYPHGTKKYFIEKKDEKDRVIAVEYNRSAWQKDIESKGFATLISSDDMTAEDTDNLYNMRDVSEKTYSIIKSQLGFSVTRTHGDDAILNKMALLFVATIIRREIVNTSKKLNIPTNVLIAELEKMNLLLTRGNDYEIRYSGSGKASLFLKEYGIDNSIIESIVKDYNERDNNFSLERKLPAPFVRRCPGRPKKEKVETVDKGPKKRGRPLGSKNKKTLLREKKEQEKLNPPPKRKPGRPRKEGT